MPSVKEERIIYKQVEFKSRKFRIFLRPDADESVVAEVFKWQEYKSAEEIIRSSRAPILDVGAHIGIFSLYAKAVNPQARIFALEPEQSNFTLLKKNVASNSLGDVKLYRVALAGFAGERKLQIEPDSINHHLVGDAEEKEGARCEVVAAVSFGEFLSENAIPAVGLLKMDIEGGEYEIFESLSAADFARVENVILEYHDHHGHHHREIEMRLRENGFGVQLFPSRFEKNLGFLLARNKRLSR